MGLRETLNLLTSAGGEEDIASLIAQAGGEADEHFTEFDSLTSGNAELTQQLADITEQLAIANQRLDRVLEMNSALLKGSTNVPGEQGDDDSGEESDSSGNPDPEAALDSITPLDELDYTNKEQE